MSSRIPGFSMYAAVFLCATVSAAHASPRVDAVAGIFHQGEEMILNGANFGTRGDFNDVDAGWNGRRHMAFRVKDFDDNSFTSEGFRLANAKTWQMSSPDRTGSGYYATKFRDPDAGSLGSLTAMQAGTTGTWHLTFWFSKTEHAGGGKFFRIYGNRAPVHAENIFLATGGTNQETKHMTRGASACSAPECEGTTVWRSPSKFVPGSWHRVDVKLSQADAGSIEVYVDNVFQWRREKWLAVTPGVYDGHTIDLGQMIDHPNEGELSPENNSYRFDDVYFDFTNARVELGNAANWSDVSYKEVQVPLEWSDNRIVFAANSGTFKPGSKAYVYVIDSNGTVNEVGLPVEIGGSSLLPKPPVDVVAE